MTALSAALAYARDGVQTGCTRPVTETGRSGVAQSGQQALDGDPEDFRYAQQVAEFGVADPVLNSLHGRAVDLCQLGQPLLSQVLL